MFYHDNQSKCLFLISLCSLRHNTWIYISSIDKPLYSILYLLNFPVAWKKCSAFSLLFYPYFSLISETAVSETVVSEIMLMFIVWIIDCYLLTFDACFCIWKICFLNHAQKSSESYFYSIVMQEKKDFDASNKPSQCFKWTIAMFYSLYFDALSTDFMCSVFIEDKTWINRDIEQRSL